MTTQRVESVGTRTSRDVCRSKHGRRGISLFELPPAFEFLLCLMAYRSTCTWWLHPPLPLLLLVAALLVATLLVATVFPYLRFLGGSSMQCMQGGPRNHSEFTCQRPIGHATVEQTWWLPRVADQVNGVISSEGPMLPYLLLVIQICTGTVEQTDADLCTWCGSGSWLLFALMWWLSLTGLRIVIFICVHPYNYYFSDHIFLLSSMVAQIQMSLAMTLQRQESNAGSDTQLWFSLECLLASVMLVFILFEAFITSWLYHTLLASWLALLASLVCFQLMTYMWVRILQRAPALKTEGSRKLMEDACEHGGSKA